MKIKSTFTPSGETIFAYLKTFTTTDADGNLIQIDGKGNVLSSPLELKNGHRITATTKSLVTLSENILTVKVFLLIFHLVNTVHQKFFTSTIQSMLLLLT